MNGWLLNLPWSCWMPTVVATPTLVWMNGYSCCYSYPSSDARLIAAMVLKNGWLPNLPLFWLIATIIATAVATPTLVLMNSNSCCYTYPSTDEWLQLLLHLPLSWWMVTIVATTTLVLMNGCSCCNTYPGADEWLQSLLHLPGPDE